MFGNLPWRDDDRVRRAITSNIPDRVAADRDARPAGLRRLREESGLRRHEPRHRDPAKPMRVRQGSLRASPAQGGRVLLGVDKNRTICGVTPSDADTGAGDTPRTYDRLEKWVMQACRDKIRPEIIPYFEVIRDVEAGLDVAVVEVERGWDTHSLWHDQHHTYYIRVGSLSREASPEELERLRA